MLMWGKKPLKNYGVHMTELILSILRHILRSEQIIKVYIYISLKYLRKTYKPKVSQLFKRIKLFYRNTLRKRRTMKEVSVVVAVELVELVGVERYLIVEKNQKQM